MAARRTSKPRAALAQGDAKQAAQVAKTPALARHRRRSARRLRSRGRGLRERRQGADGAYNKGNALAKLGRYEERDSAAYDERSKSLRSMDDAKANKAAIEEWLKRTPQQQDKS